MSKTLRLCPFKMRPLLQNSPTVSRYNIKVNRSSYIIQSSRQEALQKLHTFPATFEGIDDMLSWQKSLNFILYLGIQEDMSNYNQPLNRCKSHRSNKDLTNTRPNPFGNALQCIRLRSSSGSHECCSDKNIIFLFSGFSVR